MEKHCGNCGYIPCPRRRVYSHLASHNYKCWQSEKQTIKSWKEFKDKIFDKPCKGKGE